MAEEEVEPLDFPSDNPKIITDEEGELSEDDDLLFGEGGQEADPLFGGSPEADDY